MKKIFVGRYAMNKGSVVLFLDPSTIDSSASHGWTENAGYAAEAVVGIKDAKWPQVVRAMLHEFLELSAVRERCHYHGSGLLLPVPTDSYLIVMTHPEFTRVVDEAGDALAYALDDARKIFDKLNKTKKEKK